jgi:hypothetical protein
MNKFIKDSIKFAGLIIILNTIFSIGYLLYVRGLNIVVFGGIVAITGWTMLGLTILYHQIKVKFDINDVRFYSNLDINNVVNKALVLAIETNISSILKLKVLQNKTNNTIKELQDRLNIYTNE